jgi:hypothetical protein
MVKQKAANAETQRRPPVKKLYLILTDWRSLAVISSVTALIIIVVSDYNSNFTVETPSGYKGSWHLERPL